MNYFYENKEEKINYDFISIFSTFNELKSTHHIKIHNMIKGIGQFSKTIDGKELLENYENELSYYLSEYGADNNLLGINILGSLNKKDKHLNDTKMIDAKRFLLLHEIGHYWCCYVGNKFDIKNDNILGIIDSLYGVHWYNGLNSSKQIRTPMGGGYWVKNNNNTYKKNNR